jgi:hypothetical protein
MADAKKACRMRTKEKENRKDLKTREFKAPKKKMNEYTKQRV